MDGDKTGWAGQLGSLWVSVRDRDDEDEAKREGANGAVGGRRSRRSLKVPLRSQTVGAAGLLGCWAGNVCTYVHVDLDVPCLQRMGMDGWGENDVVILIARKFVGRGRMVPRPVVLRGSSQGPPLRGLVRSGLG